MIAAEVGNAKVPYDDARYCWIAPGGKPIPTKEKARQMAEKINEIMAQSVKMFGTGEAK